MPYLCGLWRFANAYLVKIERGVQHIKATQLKAIKEILDTSYDETFK